MGKMENSNLLQADKLGSVQAWMIWILSVLFTIWVHVIQTGYAIFNPQIQASIGLSIQQIGFAAAVYPCTAAILQLFTGNLMDQFGPRKTIVPGVICVTIGAYLLSQAEGYHVIICSQVVMAVGTCFGFAGSGYITSIWFSKKHFGVIFGLVQVVLSFSVAFGQIGFDGLLRLFYWRDILTNFFIFGLVLSILFILFMKAPFEIQKIQFDPKVFFMTTVKRSIYVLRHRDVILCAIYGGIVYGFIWALGVVWLPKIIVARQMPLQIGNYAVSGLWLGVAMGSLIVDRLWNQIGSTRKILMIFLGIQFVSLFTILYMPLTRTSSIMFSVLMGFGTSSHMLTYTIGKYAVPDQYSGSAISIVNAFMFFIGGVFAAGIGAYLEKTMLQLHDYRMAAMIFWGGMIVALISSLLFREKDKLIKHQDDPVLGAGA